MKNYLFGVAMVALTAALPTSAQILGGGGPIGGGGLGGRIGGTIGTGIERGTRVGGDTVTRVRGSADVRRDTRLRRGERSVAGSIAGNAAVDNVTRIGEPRIVSRGAASADVGLALDAQSLRTRGAVAATRRGLRRVASTATGVQVFVPQTAIAAPALPRVPLRSYPVFGPGYYYEPGAVYVGSSYVDVYMDRQYRDLETSLRGTGATVERRGDDLVVLFPADVTFAFDKADIRSRFYGTLNAFARTLSAYPGTDVEILGHTDALGSESYNIGLSERRGRSVADFLVGRQVSPARLVVQAIGEGEPIATNATVEGRAANRRVELVVHPRVG